MGENVILQTTSVATATMPLAAGEAKSEGRGVLLRCSCWITPLTLTACRPGGHHPCSGHDDT